MEFIAETFIDAEPEKVWAVLTDLPAWKSWNTTIIRTEGTIALGNKVKVEVTANPGKSFPVKVTEMQHAQRLVFTGGMPLGLFKGVRAFTLQQTGTGTSFTMREAYSGPFSAMITKSIPDLQPSFDQFAADLKKDAESTT